MSLKTVRTESFPLTTENFAQEVLASEMPVLVDVWAPWCGPCRMLGPIVEAIASEFAGRVAVGKLNADTYPELASQYGVQAIPTLLVFQNGQVVDRAIGVIPQAALAERLNSMLKHQPAA